jgi:hypothetical protein
MQEIRDRNISSRKKDKKYRRLQFVRYADDFLIGIIGSKADCLVIREKIQNFLAEGLKMSLNIEKTKITHARDDMALFLGTNIRISPTDLRPTVPFVREGVAGVMRAATRPQLYIPIDRILERLDKRGLSKGGRPKY